LGKTRRGEREYSREQKLQAENKKLKGQISSLRKQLARIDLDRYSHVRDMLDEYEEQDKREDAVEILERMKKDWKCRECNVGYLEVFLYNKIDKTFYYRKCTNCIHRTPSQQYTPDVTGIFKEKPEPK